ncbi:MAG: hypothetical protein AB1351_03420 [Thermoproteota archaeon]
MAPLNRSFVKDSGAHDVKIEELFNESTIELMKEYFHVHDRDALLKYLKDTIATYSERTEKR